MMLTSEMATPAGATMGSTGEAILFCGVAVIMIAGGLGVLFFKKAAYAAISMVTVMVGLAVIYIMQSAPFLGIAQIVVYTGAIMMLFLFVLMMIGIQASDEYARQRRGYITTAVIAAILLAVALVTAVVFSNLPVARGFAEEAASDQPIEGLAQTLFGGHWFSMELAAALLITAALGAVFLTHADRLTPKRTQRHVVEAKMAAYAAEGRHIGQHTAPGVYARTNAADIAALSGETEQPVEDSVPRVLRVRGLDRELSAVDPKLARQLAEVARGDSTQSLHGKAANDRVGASQAWGMAGKAAPTGLEQQVAPTAIEAGDSKKELEEDDQ
ncbi:NADH-quinone oxidoreductase subunit J [Gleimia hominis]|uniref:NADH-quinone oxidoreductase subunit J n=1 Tax=Gleimia hominis TaxID=595468 RepID=UPI001E4D52D4|nr:NADH-quinone oxidoreductase subunit J [Gleimia hominis]WIK64546.1 NADH-quinone oxidoreductase subunit J [Gleimia hominis]